MAFIVFNHIGSHLQRRIKYHPVCNLLRQRRVYTAIFAVFHIPLLAIRRVLGTLVHDIEYARRIIHRSGKQTGERQHDMMFRRITFAPSIPFHATGTFTGHHIGVCTSNSGVLDGLVHIEGGMIFRRGFYNIAIMTHIILPVMIVSVGKSACITGFHRMDAQISIPFI